MRSIFAVLALASTAVALSSPAQAVELHAATNQQLVAELSRRLSGGGDNGGETFSVTAACDGSDLEVTVYNSDFVETGRLEEYFSGTCGEALATMPFAPSGRIAVGATIAICDNSDLEVYGVKPDGTLKLISDLYQGSAQKCLSEMRASNARI